MVSQLDEQTNWDQTQGIYSPDKEKCCIGARLAKHFDAKYDFEGGTPPLKDGEYYYEDAIVYLCSSMDMGEEVLNALLHVCGAPSLPFSSLWWKHPTPEGVWKNVLMVEKILDKDKLIELATDEKVIAPYDASVEYYVGKDIIKDYDMFNGVLEFNDKHMEDKNIHN